MPAIPTIAEPNAPLTLGFIRRTVRALEIEGAEQEFVLELCPDDEALVRDMPGFVPAERYAASRAYPNELGKLERTRVVMLPENVYTEFGGHRHVLTATSVRQMRLEAARGAL